MNEAVGPFWKGMTMKCASRWLVLLVLVTGMLVAAVSCKSGATGGGGDEDAQENEDDSGADKSASAKDKTFPVCLTKEPQAEDAGFASNHLLGNKDFLWENDSTLNVDFIGKNPAIVKLVKEIAPTWSEHANIRFKFFDSDKRPRRAHIRIALECKHCQRGACGHYSALGSNSVPANIRNGHSMCLARVMGESRKRRKRIVLHEFGHALGLFHEHQRKGIDWNKKNVYAFCKQSQGWDKRMCDAQVLRAVEDTTPAHKLLGTPYDPLSIMHYDIPSEWIKGGKPIKESMVLSALDKRGIGKLYPKTKEPTGPTQGGGFVALKNTAEGKKWTLFVDGPKERLSNIQQVLYILHPSVVPPEAKGDSSKVGHPFSSSGPPFTARAFIHYKDGTAELLKHTIDPSAGATDAAASTTGISECDKAYGDIFRCFGDQLSASTKRDVEEERKTVARLAKNPAKRSELKTYCKKVITGLQAKGCK